MINVWHKILFLVNYVPTLVTGMLWNNLSELWENMNTTWENLG